MRQFTSQFINAYSHAEKTGKQVFFKLFLCPGVNRDKGLSKCWYGTLFNFEEPQIQNLY